MKVPNMDNSIYGSAAVKPTLSLIATLFIMLGYSYFQSRDIFGLYCLVSGILIYILKIIVYHYIPESVKNEQE